ncbi:MAG: Sua5/YciO/YrdC/YwlC family protein [Gammaproteobacteria bacterium]|nr:Sua5/YciO/YrdC/YwlC family protein [Gammaproteobacteria bacterium]
MTTQQGVEFLKQGEIIAYPTEAVYGLGCDPANHQALEDLLCLKQRSTNKGLILIAADLKQVEFYIDYINLSQEIQIKLFNSEDFITWLLPLNKKNLSKIDPLLYSNFDTIAVRISGHPVVKNLCNLFNGPIISTSANLSGADAIKDPKILQQVFINKISGIVLGDLGGYENPSTIINSITGKIIRK